MTRCLKNSFIWRIWPVLLGWITNSGIACLCRRAEQWVCRCVKGSAVCQWLARPGRIPAWYRESVLCRALDGVANALPSLLRSSSRFCRAWENSWIARFAAACGEHVPALLSWFFLLVMVCPQKMWNNAYSLAIALAGVLLCYVAAIGRPTLRLRVKEFNPYLLVFFAMLLFGTLNSASFMTSLRYLTYFVSAILLALLVVSTVETVEQFKRLCAFGAAGIPVAAGCGLYQRFVLEIENSELVVDMSLNASLPGRVYSFFENSNTFAQVLVMMIGLALGLLVSSRSKWGKALSLFTLVCGLVAIVMTYSRASWIGLVVTVFVFVLLVERRLIPVLIVGAFALLPFLPASIFNRLLSIFNFSDTSTSTRFMIYSSGFKVWSQSPVFGVGLGTELAARAAHMSSWFTDGYWFPHYHNIYIQLAVELGLVGSVACTGGFIGACKETIHALFGAERDWELYGLTMGCLSGLVGVMVCGLADYLWHYPRVMVIFWIVLGLMLCGAKLAREKKQEFHSL